MKYLTLYLRLISLAIMVVTLSACQTAPQKPYQPQQPPRTQPPPPPPAAPSQSQQSQQQQPAQSSAQSQDAQQPQSEPSATPPPPSEQAQSTPPPPSTDTADVQITDIPVDEHGNPIIDPNPTPSSTAESQDPSRQSTSSGAPPPPSGDSGGSNPRGSQMAGAEGGPNINIGARTEAERVAALEQNLDDKLAKFDELMRRAREDAERDRAAAGGGASASGGRYAGAPAGAPDGQGGRQTPPQNGRGAGGQADTNSGRGHTPDLAGNSGKGEFKYAGGTVPNDIQNARDDDIVARQLREAATRESDPVLREKLWDEYRKYKKGIGG